MHRSVTPSQTLDDHYEVNGNTSYSGKDDRSGEDLCEDVHFEPKDNQQTMMIRLSEG